MSTAASILVTDALMELGVLGVGDTPSADDSDWTLRKLNRLLNRWNTDRNAVTGEQFLQFTIIPNQNPTTIGPTGADWTVSQQRPVEIDYANVVLNSSAPVVREPIEIHPFDWWARVSVQDATSQFPTDLYYTADFPTGTVYLWPVPTTAYGIELVVRSLLSDTLVLTTALNLPPGYQDALTLTLAEETASSFRVPITADLARQAANARTKIFGLNTPQPPFSTADAGIPGRRRGRATFNYRTGTNFPMSR